MQKQRIYLTAEDELFTKLDKTAIKGNTTVNLLIIDTFLASVRLQFEAEDAHSAYVWLRGAGISVSRTVEDIDDGISKWVIVDPGWNEIEIKYAC